ncbi:MAG: hypothetical protein ACRDJH_07950 [Thermomicrobiales bacterium]
MHMDEDTATRDRVGFSRRWMLAGIAGAGASALVGSRLAFAQDATPEVGDATDDTDTPEVDGATDETTTGDSADLLAAVDEAIALVQADRDAVGTTADLAVVDQLLAQATAPRSRVEAATAEGEARRSARAATSIAKAAGDLIEAQFAAYGLPSQEAAASRVLADSYEMIVDAGEEAADATDPDASAAIAFAQQLYQAAYDLYGAGTYAQASRTAKAAGALATVGAMLVSSEGVGGFGSGRAAGRRGRGSRGGDFGGRPDGDRANQEPVEVPEPVF